MAAFTSDQLAALAELSAVADVIRGLLPDTAAFTPANQICAWLVPTPSEHFAAPTSIDRQVASLRDILTALANGTSPLPRPHAVNPAHVGNLLRELECKYGAVVTAFQPGLPST